MWKWTVYKLYLIALICLISCSRSTVTGPVSVTLIQPTSEHCKYTIAPATIETLDSLNFMRGKVGQVVTTQKYISEDKTLLDNASNFSTLDLQFTESKGHYGPMDLTSLMAASLYYSIEKGYLLFKSLDPSSDLAALVPNLNQTLIVHEAKNKSGKSASSVTDNAEYLPWSVNVNGTETVLNYFFSYPTKDSKDMPLGLNLGIMVHEFTHLAFQHLFYQPGIKRNIKVRSSTLKPTENTLAALDEGLADYMGFLATKDAGYFLCSFPQENRDLRVTKEFTETVTSAIEKGGTAFDSHEGGAVFAAIQFQIGEALKSHEENATSLIKFMKSLIDCPEVQGETGVLAMNFADIAKCHARQFSDTSRSSIVQTIYQKYLGPRYRGI